jgi:hypothetical protein
MTLTKDRRSNTYIIRYKDQYGKNHTISTKQTDKEAATKVAKQAGIAEIEQAARAGRITKEVIGRIISGRRIHRCGCHRRIRHLDDPHRTIARLHPQRPSGR